MTECYFCESPLTAANRGDDTFCRRCAGSLAAAAVRDQAAFLEEGDESIASSAGRSIARLHHTNTEEQRTMPQPPDDFYVSAKDTEFELIDAGAYPAEVLRIDPFEGRDFNTGEPKPGIKMIFKIIGGDWDGAEVDRVMSLPKNLANDSSILYAFFKGITGQIPEKGRNYAIRKELVGKRCTAIVEHHVNGKGQTFARVQSVAPQSAGRRRPVVVAQPVIEDDDDDLAGA